MAGFTRIRVRNYRALADLDLELGPVNVLFGPNGSGKSTLLDAFWFFRDCAVRGVETASAVRSHGIGMLNVSASEGAQIEVKLSTDAVEYGLQFGMSAGRIEPYPGERLVETANDRTLLLRGVGAESATVWHATIGQEYPLSLREPEKLSLPRYLDFCPDNPSAVDLDRLLHTVNYYHSRSFDLYSIKVKGSETGTDWFPNPRAQNLWTVLDNLDARRRFDARYETVVQYMQRALPGFDSLVIDRTGPTTLYGSILERGFRDPILASGVSDGHLQMLIVLTALFAVSPDRAGLILLDEPELALQPWALQVLAEAVREATSEWNKQVVIATHSPVLMSQFATTEVIASESVPGKAQFRRLSNIPEIQDLLDEYATGSLYMANLVASQRPDGVEP